MKRQIVWSCFFAILVTLSQAKRWNTNKDSIIVDAHYNNEESDPFQSDDVGEKAECYTSNGEPGECVTVIRCHPILFSEKGQLRNSGLAFTYAQSEDVCATQNNLDGNSSERKTANEVPGDSQIGQKVICCSKDRIQYELRSESLDDELETYTTPSPDSDSLPTTGANLLSVDQVQDATAAPITNVGYDVVVVESEKSSQVGHAQIETGHTTLSPPQPDVVVEEAFVGGGEPYPEAEPLPVVVDEIVEIVTSSEFVPATSSPLPEVTESQSIPEPESVPEVAAPEEVVPTSACPTTASYGKWPLFMDYPWLATIQTRAKTGPTCSGSLITEHHVLLSAACVHRFNSRDVARMQIRIGFTKRSTNDTFNDYYVLRNASKIIFHKRFHEQSKMDNNIALIKLDEPISEFGDHVAPIGIFNGLGGFDTGNCSASEAGWIKYGNRRVTGISGGVIQFVEPPMSDFHLRESLSRVLSNEECDAKLNSQINEKMLCAKSTYFEEPSVSTDFFRWNDGGPLVVKVGNRVQQIGIKSWAYEGQQYPTVYTRVDEYLDWIRNNLKM